MRLLFPVFLLAAVLVPALDAVNKYIGYSLPQGLPDGSVYTITIWHMGDMSASQPISIEFYDTAPYREWDDHAHFRVDKGVQEEGVGPVVSNTFLKGKWMDQKNGADKQLDETPPSVGWWRIDMYKHDEFHMSIFLQGFNMGVRKFDKSLNNIKALIFHSDFVDFTHNKVQNKLPNQTTLAPVTVDRLAKFAAGKMPGGTKLASFKKFPIGARLEMIAVLNAFTGDINSLVSKTPTLGLKSVGGNATSSIVKITQEWLPWTENNFDRARTFPTHQLYISNPGNYTDGTLCINSNMKPNGDLLHLDMKRVSKDVVRLRVLWKFTNGIDKGIYTCADHKLLADRSKDLDGPFNIVSDDGALLLRVEMKNK